MCSEFGALHYDSAHRWPRIAQLGAAAIVFLFLANVVPLSALAQAPGGPGTHPTLWGGSGLNLAEGMVVDSSGNSYVVGTSTAFSTSYSAVVVKFSPAGALLWQRVWGGTNGAQATGVAISGDGSSLYVTGEDLVSVSGGQLSHAFLMKLAMSDGHSLWGTVKYWSGIGSNAWNDVPLAIAATPQLGKSGTDGGVYITGFSDSTNVYQCDSSTLCPQDGVLVLRYDQSGNLLWADTLAVPEAYYKQGCLAEGMECDSYADAILVGPGGYSVYIGGSTYISYPDSVSKQQGFVAAFTPPKSGAKITMTWLDYFAGVSGTGNSGVVTALALSGDGTTLYAGGEDFYCDTLCTWGYVGGLAATLEYIQSLTDYPGDFDFRACAQENFFFACSALQLNDITKDTSGLLNSPPNPLSSYIIQSSYAFVASISIASGEGTGGSGTWRLDWGSFNSYTYGVVGSIVVAPDGSLLVSGLTSAECNLPNGVCTYNAFVLDLSSAGSIVNQGIWGVGAEELGYPEMAISGDGGSIVLSASEDGAGPFDIDTLSGQNMVGAFCNSASCGYSGVTELPPSQILVPSQCKFSAARDCANTLGNFILNTPCDPNLTGCAAGSTSSTLPSAITPAPNGAGIDFFLQTLPLPEGGSYQDRVVQPLILQPQGTTLTVSVSGCGSSPPSVLGDWTPHDIIAMNGCSPVTLSLTNPGGSTQYVFDPNTDATSMSLWACNGSYWSEGIICPTDTIQIYAQYQISYTVSPSGSGQTSPSGSNVWTNSGIEQINANPASGYYFSYWSSGPGILIRDSTSSSTTATISGPGTITAVFSTTPPGGGGGGCSPEPRPTDWVGAGSFVGSLTGCGVQPCLC